MEGKRNEGLTAKAWSIPEAGLTLAGSNLSGVAVKLTEREREKKKRERGIKQAVRKLEQRGGRGGARFVWWGGVIRSGTASGC